MKIISLATFSKLINSKLNFLKSVQSLGFEVLTVKGPNRRLIQHGYLVDIPLHYLLIRWGHAVHLALFYDREMNYWWHGELVVSKVPELNQLGFGKDWKQPEWVLNEGAYDKFEINPVEIEGIKFHLPDNIPRFLNKQTNSKFIECNYTRAELYRKKYGLEDSSEAAEFKSSAWRLLSKAKSLLDELSIPFWLSSGTCLGYFRQCDIIRHSRDVDIGIWIKDYDQRIISKLSSHGLPLKHIFGRVNDSFELSFQDGDIKLDIFFFYEEKDYMWNGGTQARTGKKFKYIFPKFTLCWTEFLELKVRIPCQTEAYILANYGNQWSVPTKTWDWKKSPSNVHENGQWPEEDWPVVIRLFQTSNNQ